MSVYEDDSGRLGEFDEFADDSYGACDECGQDDELDDGVCESCWVDEFDAEFDDEFDDDDDWFEDEEDDDGWEDGDEEDELVED